MARSEIGPMIRVRMPVDLIRRIDAAAHKAALNEMRTVSRAEYVRRVLQDALGR